MATFPTAEELQRPVPRVDGSVPTYQVTPTSDAGPRAMAQAGQTIQSLGQDVGQFAERLDMTDAQDALNKFRQKRQELTFDPDKGFMRLKGRDAIGKGADGKSIMDTTASSLDMEAEALAKNLSPRAAAAFRARAINETTAFKTDLIKHQIDQSEKYEAATYTGAQAITLNRAAQSFESDRDLDIYAKQAGDRARQYATTKGLDGPASDAAAQAAESDVYKAGLTMRIAKGDPSAIGYFEKHKDKFDAKDRIGLESSIKELTTTVGATNWMAGAPVDRAKFLSTITPHAIAISKETGLDPRLVIAQSALETGYGKDAPGNNFFGIKSHGRPGGQMLDTKEAGPNGELVPARESFRTYGSVGESAKDYAQFVKSNGIYAPVLAAKGLDAQIEAMGKSGYATDKDYTAKLRQIAHSLPDPNASRSGEVAQGDAVAAPGTPGPIAPRTVTTATGDTFLADYNPATGSMRSVPEKGVGNGIATSRDLKIDAQEIYLQRMEANARDNGSNPPLFAKVKGMIEAEFAQNKVKVQLYADQTWNQVQEYIAKGGPNGGPALEMPPAQMMAAIKPELHDAIAKRIALNIEGKKVKTQLDVYGRINDNLTSTNANTRRAWSNIPMELYASMLSPEDVKHFMTMQGQIRENEDKFLSEVSVTQANALADKLGITRGATASTSDAKKYGSVVRLFQNELTLFEAQKGKKATFKEAQEIEDSVTKKTAAAGTLWDGETPVAMLTWDQIPADERRRAAAAIRKAGGTPTEDEVVDFVKHMRVRAPVKALDRPWPTEWEGAGQDAAPPPPNAAGSDTHGGATFGGNTYGGNTFGGNTYGGNTFGGNTFGRSSDDALRRELGLH